MPAIEVISEDPISKGQAPVKADIYALSSEAGRRTRTYLGRTNAFGMCTIPKVKHALLICPSEQHWAQIVRKSDLTKSNRIVVRRFSDASWWWECVVGCRPPKVQREVRVGVIDIGFPNNLTDQLLNFEAIEGWLLENAQPRLPSEDFGAYHGFVVSKILASTKIAGFSGLSAGAQIFFANIGPRQKSCKYAYNFDVFSFSAAFTALVEDYRVNIINASLGFDWTDPNHGEEIEHIKRLIDYAWSKGVAVVCAAGNNQRAPLVYPAKLANALAVTGVGPCDLAPSGSYVHDSEIAAGRTGKVSRELANGYKLFLDPYCSIGSEVNYAAPSLGINIPFPLGSLRAKGDPPVFFQEFDGTSFSAPIITGRLACLLRDDALYWSMDGSDRGSRAVQCLNAVCNSLGFAKDEVGSGIPCLYGPN